MKHLVNLFLLLMSIHLGWNPSTGATGYKLYYGQSTGVYTSIVDVGNVTNYIIEGIDETQPIFFAATAYNSYTESEFSTELEATTITTTFAGPGQLNKAPLYAIERNQQKTTTVTITPPTADYHVSATKLNGSWITPTASVTLTDITDANTIYFVVQKTPTMHGIEWIK